MALTESERRELDDVVEAPQRLESKKFGTCNDCGDEIGFDRLKAEPWAHRCIACETQFERRTH